MQKRVVEPQADEARTEGGRGMMFDKCVAWIRFEHGLIKVCDSGDPKAFRVYRWTTVDSRAAAQLAEKVSDWKADLLDTGAEFILINGERHWVHDAKEIVRLHNAQLAEKEREIVELETQMFELVQRAETAEKQIAALRSTIDEDGKQFTAINEEMLTLRERLRQREAELEQRWIAVGERLPEIVRHFGGKDNNMYGESEKILIFNEEPNIGWLYKSGTWDSVDGNKIEKVTHWQPLPSPPKEAK